MNASSPSRVNPSRLAIVSAGELFGGVERQILDLCRHRIRNDEISPLVVLFHDHELARQLQNMGVQPHFLKSRHRYDWDLLDSLTTILRTHQIQVVHAHGYKATITCGLVKPKLGFRLVKTEHGIPEASIRRPVGWFKSRLNFMLEKLVTRRTVDHVCYVSRDIAGFFKRHHSGLTRSVVHNGLDPLDRSDYSRPADLPEGGTNFGIVGRVSEVKGIPFALQALANSDLPPSARIVIVGTGDIVESLKAKAVEHGVSEQVLFLGFRDNVYDYIAHFEAVMMPSLHEGLPYTLLEAMSLARPIIASNVGGLAEVLCDGRNGLLVPVGDVAKLASAMFSVVNDVDSARVLGEQGRLDQAENYTLDRMVESYQKIWSGTPD